MTRPRRWFVYGPFLFAGAALLLWLLLWRSAALSMRSGLEEFGRAAEANGVAVAHAPVKARGFPFFLRGVVDDLSIEKDGRRYACGRAYLDASPHAPDRMIFSCGGGQSIAFRDDIWTVDAEGARASIGRDAERGWIAKIETGEATLANGEARIALKLALLNVWPKEGEPAVLEASLHAGPIEALRPEGRLRIDRLDAAGSMSASGAPGERTFTIYGAEAEANGAVLKANGALALAADGALHGRLQSRIEKPVGFVRTLAEAGLLAPDEARAAEAAFAILSVASGGAIEAPIDISDGRMRLAGLSLAVKEKPGQP